MLQVKAVSRNFCSDLNSNLRGSGSDGNWREIPGYVRVNYRQGNKEKRLALFGPVP